MQPTTYTKVVLPPCNRGRNARGTSAAKRGWGGSAPKGAKRAKRQGVQRMGNSPRLGGVVYGDLGRITVRASGVSSVGAV